MAPCGCPSAHDAAASRRGSSVAPRTCCGQGVVGGVRLAEVARRCHLSLSQFGRTFKKTTGLTPHRWLVKLRLERAQDLMLWTTLPLAEIALDCGFSEQSHFTRTFTRLVGTSPGEWRRQRRR
jgi:AraC family transcriptional regulator